jgi:hypothetical protein
MVNPEPGKEHAWLQQLAGEWAFESVCEAPPGEAPAKSSGTERVRALGPLWVLAEGEGEMPGGGQARTVMTLGFDPQRGHFAGTWIGSMMTHLWIYTGQLDGGESVLTLETEGPDMVGQSGTRRYRDVIDLTGGERLLKSYFLSDDGQWQLMMTARYRRTG